MSEQMPAPHGATAAEWSEKWFGGPTRPIRTNVTVGISSVELLPNNPKRVFWRIQNRSANNVYLEIGSPAVVATSFLLGAGGGFIESSVQEDGEMVAYQVQGIADLAGSVVMCLAVVRV